MFNFWWSAWLVDGLEPHPPPLSSQKNKMLLFGLCSTSDDWPGQSMDSNPVCHPSPAKKIKCSVLDYIQLLMIGRLVDGLKPHPQPLCSQKIKCSFLDYVQLLGISQTGRWTQTPSATPLQPKKIKCSFLDYIQLMVIGRAGRWTQTPSATPLQTKNEMLIFGLRSTSDDQSSDPRDKRWLKCKKRPPKSS